VGTGEIIPKEFAAKRKTNRGFSMSTLRFVSIIKIRDGNPYIYVNAARARAVKPGWRKPLPVLVRINGKPTKPWRINMMPVGNGSFYLYLHVDVHPTQYL
jgi:hypothetical protein